ncbi:MAG TPA: asparaginase [Fibrobacteria bacterium]|nr:asparaginase [Fibrobacteria bacterium]
MEMTCGPGSAGDSLKESAAPLVTVTRNGRFDMQHLGFACLADAAGNRIWSLGDPHAHAYFRSSAKPLQALAMLTSGAADAAGLDDRDLAIVCGSHAGGAGQTAQVRALLAKSGLRPDQLGCGPREGSESAAGGGDPGGEESVLADMCSGKHAGMLTACKHLGLPLDTYLEPGHPWQRRILATVCEYCAADPAETGQAVDGCSAPTPSLPIYNMALGFARLAKEAGKPGPAARLLRAMAAHPDHTGEPDLRGFALENAPPTGIGAAFVTKGGANGLHCAALPGLGLGFAMKVMDGAQLPRWPVFTRALERAGILSPASAAAMRAALWPRILTRKGVEAGDIRVDF